MKKNNIKELMHRFTYRAEWSEEDGVYIGFCLELPSVKAHADTPEGAIKEVKIPIEAALNWMKEDKEELPVPLAVASYKGKLLIRTTPEKHKELALRAAESGVSINQYVLSKIG